VRILASAAVVYELGYQAGLSGAGLAAYQDCGIAALAGGMERVRQGG
jgi:hypothetical protein